MRSATFQLGLVPFGCNRLIVRYWISLPPRVRRASFRHSASSHSPLLVGICFNLVFCVIASSLCPDLAAPATREPCQPALPSPILSLPPLTANPPTPPLRQRHSP